MMPEPIFTQKKSAYSDQEVWEGLLVNDRATTQYLYQKAYPLVAAQLRRMGAEQEDIRDIFQEGMVVLWKNIHEGSYKLQASTRISTYLVQVCKWQWSDQLKKARTKKEVRMDGMEDSSVARQDSPSVLDQWMKEEEMERFHLLFHKLGTRCQNLLQHFYFDRQSMKEIAQVFSITEATARNEKYRCMKRIKHLFHTQQS